MVGAYSKGDLLAICNSSMGALGGGANSTILEIFNSPNISSGKDSVVG